MESVTLENNLEVSLKTEHTTTLQPNSQWLDYMTWNIEWKGKIERAVGRGKNSTWGNEGTLWTSFYWGKGDSSMGEIVHLTG